MNAGHSKDLKKIEIYTIRNTILDGMAALTQEQEELLQRQQRLIEDFKKLTLTLQDHMYATSIDSRVFPEEFFAKVSKLAHTPDQLAIDEALIPIIVIDESYMDEYQELSIAEKYIANINGKIKQNRQKIELKRDKISGESLISSSLFNPTNNEQPGALKKKSEAPENCKLP